jgi:acetoin utilization protein AcuB
MISPTTSAAEAQQIMTDNKIRHLPVVGDGKRVLGLISRQRLRIPPTDLASLNVWEISRYLNDLLTKDVMVKKEDLLTIEPDETMENAAMKMIEHKVGCLLVLEEDIVVGIITEVDMLAQLADLLGGTSPGIRATMRMPNTQGQVAKLMNAVSSKGWSIYASGGVQSPKDKDHWDCILKVRGVSKEDLVKVLEDIEDQEIIDVR